MFRQLDPRAMSFGKSFRLVRFRGSGRVRAQLRTPNMRYFAAFTQSNTYLHPSRSDALAIPILRLEKTLGGYQTNRQGTTQGRTKETTYASQDSAPQEVVRCDIANSPAF